MSNLGLDQTRMLVAIKVRLRSVERSLTRIGRVSQTEISYSYRMQHIHDEALVLT